MEELDPEEQFLRDARNGNLAGIQRLLMSKIKEEAKFNINCKGIVCVSLHFYSFVPILFGLLH